MSLWCEPDLEPAPDYCPNDRPTRKNVKKPDKIVPSENSESPAYIYNEPPNGSAFIFGSLMVADWLPRVREKHGLKGGHVQRVDELRNRTGIPSLQIASFYGPGGMGLVVVSIFDSNLAYKRQYRPLLTQEQMDKYVTLMLGEQPRWWRYIPPCDKDFQYDPRQDDDSEDEGTTIDDINKGMSLLSTIHEVQEDTTEVEVATFGDPSITSERGPASEVTQP